MPQNKHNQLHQMSGYQGWHQEYFEASPYQAQMIEKIDHRIETPRYSPIPQQQSQQQNKQGIRQQYQGQYAQLSTKDFNYLKDHLSWELLAAKKCAHYAAECQDPQIAHLINQVGQMHERHYNALLQYMNPQAVQS
jgi:hypothetical protein